MKSGSDIIGITTGDPKGIGPEVVAKALRDFPPQRFRIFGPLASDVSLNDLSASSIALESLQSACRALRDREISGVVTAPVNKKRMGLVDPEFTGHTEFFAREFGREVTMFFVAPELRVSLVTRHLPLQQVSKKLTPEEIVRTIHQTDEGLRRHFGMASPRLACCGLNPHAGEEGLLGREDSEIIAPAIAIARSSGIDVVGPFSGDTLFWEARHGKYDAVIAMYHDQGLAPIKTLSFNSAVQVTLGLPFLRFSVDHGTAENLAGKNRADPTNMISTLRYALQFVKSGQ